MFKRRIAQKLIPFELQGAVIAAVFACASGMNGIGAEHDHVPGDSGETLALVFDMDLPVIDLQNLKRIMPMRLEYIVSRIAFVKN